LLHLEYLAASVDWSPYLRTTNRNIGIDLEAQSHVRASDIEHRDFEQAMEAVGPANHDRFPAFSRQD
jgi:hypothetical protein